MDISIEKVNNDTYLKIFDQSNLDKKLKPQNNDVLKSEIKFNLINEEYELQTGLISYENLQKNKADRYEFILPYYNFSTELKWDEAYSTAICPPREDPIILVLSIPKVFKNFSKKFEKKSIV